jgi:hypothetical protein
MKKFILRAIVVSSILASCSKEDGTASEKTGDKNEFKSSILNKNSSSSKIAGKEYTEQLPYLDAHTDFMAFNVENDLAHKMNDTAIDWQTLNALYSSDLNTASKQYLIYIVLAKKDLLGIQNTTPTQAQATIIANYAQELVNSKYIGYSLLYNTLATLNNDVQYGTLVKTLAAQIIADSKTENFHSNFINRPEGRDPYIEKVKEDYTYLGKIQAEF